MVSLPIAVQLVPFDDRYALTVVPDRTSRTQYGAWAVDPRVFVDCPPVAVRRWKATPFAADTSAKAWAAFAFSEARIMTPDLDH